MKTLPTREYIRESVAKLEKVNPYLVAALVVALIVGLLGFRWASGGLFLFVGLNYFAKHASIARLYASQYGIQLNYL